jgi:hypothetical protein
METLALVIVVGFGVIFFISFFVSLQNESARAKRCTVKRMETFSDVSLPTIERKHRAAVSFAVKVKNIHRTKHLHRAS